MGTLLGQINAANLGITVSYDTTLNKLTIARGSSINSFTLAEATDHGGNGFFAVNGIAAAATGTTYGANAKSSAPVTSNTEAILSDPNKPITDYAFAPDPALPDVLQTVSAGDIAINGVTIHIGAGDTLKDVIDRINATSGNPNEPGHHVRAFYAEGSAPDQGRLFLKETVWGEAIHLTDAGNTHFWQAMHLQDDSSGQALVFKRNGVTDSTGVATNLAETVNPTDGYKTSATVAPGVTVTFQTADSAGYGSDFFVGPHAATAGLYSGPLDRTSVIRVDPGTANGSGLSIANNGFVTYHLNQVTQEDAGAQAYIKIVDPMLITHDNSLQFQVGADTGDLARLGIPSVTALALFGPTYHASVSTQLNAEDLIGQTDAALKVIDNVNTTVGTFVDQLDRTLNVRRSSGNNLTNSMGLLIDTDMPSEVTRLTRGQIVSQSSMSMAAQANLNEQLVLRLIQAG